jgi:hypothetical protein
LAGNKPVTGSSLTRDLGTSPRLPQAGALVGTLAYMAPEQREGEPADARSDQVSFCVAVRETLATAQPGPWFEDDATVAHANLTRDADATRAALHSLPKL